MNIDIPRTSSLVCIVAVPPILLAVHIYSPSSDRSTSVTVRLPPGERRTFPGTANMTSAFLYQLKNITYYMEPSNWEIKFRFVVSIPGNSLNYEIY